MKKSLVLVVALALFVFVVLGNVAEACGRYGSHCVGGGVNCKGGHYEGGVSRWHRGM